MSGYSLELCAGAGGQAIGLERAGFKHVGAVENDPHACNTLRLNRPNWTVFEEDLNTFDARLFKGIELVAGGFPCPPFSIAGKQLGSADERDLFPAGMRIIDEVRPKAVMIENVRGILNSSFDSYRGRINSQLLKMGYETQWRLFNAADFGVAQLRPRVVIVAIKKQYASNFNWPSSRFRPPTVGKLLKDLMSERGWQGADVWAAGADGIAPTVVGGSKKHGGPDLGPTRARKAWATLGVDGLGIADSAPAHDFEGMPRLTVRMVARVQGFPDTWGIWGRKTAAYRQVGNAFPPPVAAAVAGSLAEAIACKTPKRLRQTSWQPAML
ncbi:MAG: DNA cytosine methyltransferase [Hyphomicrobium aestuarii]|nr:DNA cytosine methyltransferase [Hyphomicrobium aestuarii]